MLSPSLMSTVFSQIESLVFFRNKKNHKTNQSEINQIIKLHTLETERHFVRCLFSSVNCLNENKSPKDIYQAQYFSQELGKLLSKSNFVSLVCYSIENPLPTHKNNRLLSTRLFSQITQISTLNRLQEVILGLSLTHSNDPQLSAHAKQWVHQKLPELVTTHLAVYDGFMLSKQFDPDNSIIFKFLESTRSVLCNFDVDDLNPLAIAKCLCLFLRTTDGQLNKTNRSNSNDNTTFYNNTIFRYDDNDKQCGSEDKQSDELNTPSVLSSSWNIDNFFTVLYELNPNIQLTIILNELDCSEFMITSRQSFHLFKQFIFNHNQFHISADYFYRSWNNSLGQLSLLQYCSVYPDVICLAYWPHRCIDISMLQISFNEDEQTRIQLWKNIDYVQALLNLSDKGLYSDVYKLFKQVFFLYPDILTATLLETNFGTLRNVMLGHAFVYFLTTRINSHILLQTAWNGGKLNLLNGTDLQQQRHLFIASCIEYTAQLMTSDGSLEPSTLSSSTQISDNHQHILNNSNNNSNNLSANFSQFIELLISINDDSNTHGSSAILPILLGTTECLSIAVSNLLNPTNLILNHDNTLNNLSESMNDKFIGTINRLPIHLLLPPNHAIDLTLVLIVSMTNVIHSNKTTTTTTTINSLQITTNSEITTNTSTAALASIQTSIKSFLSQWFIEHFHDKITADPFALGVVDYLRAHYSSHVAATNTTFISRNKLALPMEIRKPSLSLLTHIIQSAQAALSLILDDLGVSTPT
uniref:CCR4-NOT transcription complex subunit 1 n=1 Tax=Schistosoma haematobium TaxID=6185 RepID=A0A095A037_SCHHA